MWKNIILPNRKPDGYLLLQLATQLIKINLYSPHIICLDMFFFFPLYYNMMWMSMTINVNQYSAIGREINILYINTRQ